jgi:DNA-binding transcriptional ArsR family regulator
MFGHVTRGDVDAVFAALADPTRREILQRMSASQETTATELAAGLPISRQAVAKHLTALREAGLASAHREGRETRYAPTAAPLNDAIAWMTSVGADWDERLARLATRARRPGAPRAP